MNIIGHRGAAGLALENTRASIARALEAGVDAVEIDVRKTKDGVFVLSHDMTLWRTCGDTRVVGAHTLDALDTVKTRNGETILTLKEALELTANTRILIEAKGSGWAGNLIDALRNVDQAITVIAQDHAELDLFHRALPEVPTYLVQRFNPIDVFQALHDARVRGFTGVDINFWLLNPLTYWLAQRYGLEIIVYTVNSPRIARFLARLFPAISITTNRPDALQFLRTNPGI